MPPAPLWQPTRAQAEQSRLKQYMNWLFVKYGLYFRGYDDCWDWSVNDLEDFWESVWRYFEVISHTPYHTVLARPAGRAFIGTQWFPGATLNYAEHVFRQKTSDRPALLVADERSGRVRSVSWMELEEHVAATAAYLRQQGVGPGDCVAAVLPNGPEAVVAFLAATSVGAVWSSCSPDFGVASIVDRFRQIAPKLLFVADSYSYGGKLFDKREAFAELASQLPGLQRLIWVSAPNSQFTNHKSQVTAVPSDRWADVVATEAPEGLAFEAVPFSHPLWVLYSSGTTGQPKAITQSVGGCLLEHLKALALHFDVRPVDRFFWYTTTGWMMWNFNVAALLTGATVVLYDGSPGYPDLTRLWQLAEQTHVTHFGAGAAFLIGCQKAGVAPNSAHQLTALRCLGVTGSPLPPDGFQWAYEAIKKDLWLVSFSGGTDVCSGFVGGNPLAPVYAGEIQTRLLGCHVEAFDDNAKPVRGEVGEMVVLKPMPSMPIYFWGDRSEGPRDNERYRASYFEHYGPAIWRHGDWIEITARGGVIIFGRSDATLNRDGVRIGTAEIYAAVESLPFIADSLVVGVERPDGGYFMPLFVVLKNGQELTEERSAEIKKTLRSQYSPRHVPDAIFAVPEVPYTISGKKLETPVKKLFSGKRPEDVGSRDTMRNPAALDAFVALASQG